MVVRARSGGCSVASDVTSSDMTTMRGEHTGATPSMITLGTVVELRIDAKGLGTRLIDPVLFGLPTRRPRESEGIIQVINSTNKVRASST